MRLFLLFFISLITTTSFSAPNPILASVEIISTTAPPVEKKKVKKKRKRRFKKPNKSTQTNSKKIRIRLILATGILLTLVLILFLAVFAFGLNLTLTGAFIYGLTFLILAAVSLTMLIITIVYNIADLRKENKVEKPLKRPIEELKEEVSYLNPDKISRYLNLNEQLTSIKIKQQAATRILKDRSRPQKERNKAKIDITNSKQDIKKINKELNALRQQNRTKKARMK